MRTKRRFDLFPAIGIGLGIGLAASMPQQASAAEPTKSSKADLVETGRRLFFEETFDGNGRTCGTCHPATNNFTIDPAFIRRLPRRDPLFVAEFNPKLRGLENPRLLRRFGLVLENPDGFDRPGVMRGVPHNLALNTTMNSDLPGKKNALGWGGDGSPGAGSLRLFAVGAVVQHLPKTLNREEGVDFRLPTDDELKALEAYMLTLGRQQEIDLAAMTFAEDVVEKGKELFNGGGTANRACSACHQNAGANNDKGVNANFDTGTRFLKLKRMPPDGGFGQSHEDGIDGYGDGTINTPSLIEAADTAPFFHNNSARTLEDAIRFYTTDSFANSPSGRFGGAFNLSRRNVNAIGALLRTLNAMENARFANAISEDAQRTESRSEARHKVRKALAETKDAIRVLTRGPLRLYRDRGRDAVGNLRQAARLQRRALRTRSRDRRNAFLDRAIRARNQASAAMLR